MIWDLAGFGVAMAEGFATTRYVSSTVSSLYEFLYCRVETHYSEKEMENVLPNPKENNHESDESVASNVVNKAHEL